jgi:hypothetical protein
MDGLYAHFFPGKQFVGECKMELISSVRPHQSTFTCTDCSRDEVIIKIPNFLGRHSAIGDVNAMREIFGRYGPLRSEFDGIKYEDYESV